MNDIDYKFNQYFHRTYFVFFTNCKYNYKIVI